ncbi:MAG: Oxidoreductase [Trizodia sp. TS-e1964]|nr:MAG: Oxidoreductase [Trizodia sp. TS-e1964]
MIAPAARSALRSSLRSNIPRFSNQLRPSQRYINTATAPRSSRSWKNLAVRCGLALGAVYFYNTSSLFAEEVQAGIAQAIPQTAPAEVEEREEYPSLDALAAERRQRILEEEERVKAAAAETSSDSPKSVEDLEEEADAQGAFNPETGEINWDCPCLGGMAHGPCGPQFREAFSCFVFSKEEPKGMDCIEKFKGMQDCFREHPEEYGSELEGDEDSPQDDSDLDAPVEESSPSSSPPEPAKTAPDATEKTEAEPKSAPSPLPSESSSSDNSKPKEISQPVEKAQPDAKSGE